jgi:hypothetical protein
MTENTIFVLLAIDTNPDPAPNEIWAFADQAKAENFLRSWSEDFLGGYTHDVDNLPPDAELVEAFRNAGTRIHLYQCDLDGGAPAVRARAGSGLIHGAGRRAGAAFRRRAPDETSQLEERRQRHKHGGVGLARGRREIPRFPARGHRRRVVRS